MTTITLPANLLGDPAFLYVARFHGTDGKLALIHLLAWAAHHRPDGCLAGVDDAMIATICDYGWESGNSVETWVNSLVKAGALTGASGAYQIADQFLPKSARGKPPAATPCPVDKIVDAYHEHLPMLARVRAMSKATETKLRTHWRDADKQTLDWWVDYFKFVARCPFLIGKGGGDRPFFADLVWLLTPGNMEKVINGRYQ